MSDALKALEQGLTVAAQKGDVAAAAAITTEMKRLLKEVNPSVDAPEGLTERGARMAAEGTTAGEAVTIGAGRKVSRIGGGIFDIFGAGPEPEDVQRRREEDVAYGALRKKHPIATAGGEAAPYVAVPPSLGILGSAATVGALETAAEGPAAGAAGGVTTAAGGLIAKPVASFLAPVSRRAAGPAHQGGLDAAQRIGLQPRLSEVTGSNWLRRLEDTVAQLPGGGGVMAEHAAGNAVALNRAAARAIGETADELTPEVFARAAQRIGKTFEDIKALPGRQIQLGPDVVAAADEVLRTQAKMLPHQQDANLIKLAKDAKWAASNGGRIDGATYQLQRSGLSDAAFDATVGTNKQLYGRLLEALDASADVSLRAAGNEALADALQIARPQYANLKTLEKGLTVEGGNVSPAKVASTMRTNNPGAFRRGNFVGSEMGDIATVGETLKPLKEGSQTFARNEANPLSAMVNAAWSYPTAKVLTSPVVSLYPRTMGPTHSARLMSEIAEPATRALVAAALQRSGALPFLPVAAEQQAP